MTMERLMEIASRTMCCVGDRVYLYTDNGKYESMTSEEFAKRNPELNTKWTPPAAAEPPAPRTYDEVLNMAIHLSANTSVSYEEDEVEVLSQSTVAVDFSNLEEHSGSECNPSPILAPVTNANIVDLDLSRLDDTVEMEFPIPAVNVAPPLPPGPAPFLAAIPPDDVTMLYPVPVFIPVEVPALPSSAPTPPSKACRDMLRCEGNCGNPFHTPSNIMLERAISSGRTWGDIVMDWEAEEEEEKKRRVAKLTPIKAGTITSRKVVSYYE